MKQLILIGALMVTSITVCVLIDLQHTSSSTASAARAESSRDASGAVAHAGARGASAMSLRANDRPSLAVEDDHRGPAAAAAGSPAAESTSASAGKEMHDHLEAMFRADHAGAASYADAQDLADNVRAMLPAGSTLRNVECRSALCRVETEHVSADDFRRFVEHAFLDRTAPMATRPVIAGLPAEPRAGQAVVAVAYVGRDGAAMAAALSASPRAPDRP